MEISRSRLRKFGLTVGSAFLVLGLLFWWRGRGFYFYLIGVGVIFAIPAIFTPIILKPVYRVWMGLAFALGWFMTRVILCILYYLVLTPIGLCCRLFGNSFLDLEIDRGAESYWIKRRDDRRRKDFFRSQF